MHPWSEEEKRRFYLNLIQAFEVAAARTHGLVNLNCSRHTGFYQCEHPFSDKTNGHHQSARILGLGWKLCPCTMPYMLKKDQTLFMRSCLSTPKSIKQMKRFAGRMI